MNNHAVTLKFENNFKTLFFNVLVVAFVTTDLQKSQIRHQLGMSFFDTS
jgi:hypothetical protein